MLMDMRQMSYSRAEAHAESEILRLSPGFLKVQDPCQILSLHHYLSHHRTFLICQYIKNNVYRAHPRPLTAPRHTTKGHDEESA